MSEIIDGSVKVIVDACFKAGYDKGYQQGRADAIEKLLKYLKSDKYDYWDIIRIAEQLKEKND